MLLKELSEVCGTAVGVSADTQVEGNDKEGTLRSLRSLNTINTTISWLALKGSKSKKVSNFGKNAFYSIVLNVSSFTQRG